MDRAEELRSYIGLLRETHAHAMGAQSIRPDQRLSDLIFRVAELEREASVELAVIAPIPTPKLDVRMRAAVPNG